MDGEPVCWGNNELGRLDVDRDDRTFGSLRIAAGNSSNYTCAIRLYGRAPVLGCRPGGVPIEGIPAELALAVPDRPRSTCPLAPDDTLYCWGSALLATPLSPPPTGQFRVLASATDDSCGVRVDRTLSCWANGEPHLLAAPSGAFRTVAGGKDYACAIRVDGTLACWGSPGSAPLTGVPSGTFRSVAAGTDGACAIRDRRPRGLLGHDLRRPAARAGP